MTIAEIDWLARAQQGDEEAFSYLVEQYQRPVFNLCYRMLGDRYEAEDMAQEVFLKAFSAIKRYDLGRPFINWLLTIASRTCIDQIRRRRLPTTSIDPIIERGVPDTGLDPEASLSQSEVQRQIQQLIKTLNPTDRAAIVMLYWYDFSYEEIADALSLTTGAVKSRLHRARKELAGQWMKQESYLRPNALAPSGIVQCSDPS